MQPLFTAPPRNRPPMGDRIRTWLVDRFRDLETALRLVREKFEGLDADIDAVEADIVEIEADIAPYLTPGSAIADPAGGATVDAEARAKLTELLTFLRDRGDIAT